MALALVATPGAGAGLPGFHGVTLDLADIEPTRAVMEHVLGWRESGREGQGASLRVRMSAPDGSGALGQHVDLAVRAAARGRFGAGSVHHIAFRAAGDAQQAEMARRLAAMGLAATPQQDRQYFRSIYFREPGGVLFEIATDPPGFAVDEAWDALGTVLMLPPQHEHLRATLEKSLPPLS